MRRDGFRDGRPRAHRGHDADNRVKVLHVIPSVSEKHGGPTYATKALTRVSRLVGIDVAVATSDDDGADARLHVPLNVPVVRDGVPHFFFHQTFASYKVSFGLSRWLSRHAGDFDLIHIHALFSYSSWAAARAARHHRVPYIVRPLGVLNRWGLTNRRPLLKRLSLSLIELPLLREAAAIHYTSGAERAEANSLHPSLNNRSSFIIPIPIDVARPGGSGDSFCRRFPQVANRRLILFLSRLDEKKGLEMLLHAFAKVREREKDSLLVIAGAGDERYVKSLHQLANELQIRDDVLWAGFIREDKADAYAAAEVFVLPSYSENFGIAAAEALAAGVPCVLSDQVALVEYLENDDSAVIVPCDAVAISNAIVELLSNSKRRGRLAERGRQVAAEQFSYSAVGQALLHMYQVVAG